MDGYIWSNISYQGQIGEKQQKQGQWKQGHWKIASHFEKLFSFIKIFAWFFLVFCLDSVYVFFIH